MQALQLGRDKDPRTREGLSSFALLLHKLLWKSLSFPGLRFMTSLVYSKKTVAYTGVEGAVAFTIDDGFCGLDNPGGCMLEEVRALFKEHDARATFFVAGSHCEHTSAEDVAALLQDGHELANHNMRDHPYVSYTREDFAADLDETEAVLANYRAEAPAWYRAPFARMTKRMYDELDARGMKHILCDAFANDTAIPDPEWIARTVLSQCQPGSIALIHMPERGCREWNLEAMRLTLAGLRERGLEVVTLSELFARA